MEKRDTFCIVKSTAVSELESAEAELYGLTTGISDGMVTKHLLKELGYEVALVNHVDSQSAKAWASKRGLGRMKHVSVEVHVRARLRGEEADDTCLPSRRK